MRIRWAERWLSGNKGTGTGSVSGKGVRLRPHLSMGVYASACKPLPITGVELHKSGANLDRPTQPPSTTTLTWPSPPPPLVGTAGCDIDKMLARHEEECLAWVVADEADGYNGTSTRTHF